MLRPVFLRVVVPALLLLFFNAFGHAQPPGADLSFSNESTARGSGFVVRHTIGVNNRDFSTLQEWEDARDGNLTTRQYFAIFSQTGIFQESEQVSGGSSGATGFYLKEKSTPTTSENTLSLDNSTGAFQTGEILTGAISGATAILNVILSSDGLIEKGEIFADALYSVGLTIAGSTTDPDHYMWLSAAPSDQHKGLAGLGVVIDPVDLGHVIDIQDPHTHISALEITGWPNQNGSNSWEGVHVAANNILLENLLIHDDDYGSYSNPNSDAINLNDMSAGETLTIRNSIIYNIGRGGIVYQGTEDLTLNAQNVSIYNTALSGSAADGDGGIRSRGSAVTYNLHNVISMNSASGADFNNAGSYGNSSNNLSSDNSAPGANALIGRLAEDQFLSISPGSVDLHLKATADALDVGLDLSSEYKIDIDGFNRLSPWDIGADELEGGLSIADFSALIIDTTLTMKDQLSNIGTADAAAFDVSYYLSLDEVLDAADHLVCSRSISGLAAGTSSPLLGTTETTCLIPPVSPGDYFVLALVDSGQNIPEVDEANNLAVNGLDPLSIGPDLSILSADSPPRGLGYVVTHSIGSNNRNFTSLQEWEDARDGDLINRGYFAISNQTGVFQEGEQILGLSSNAEGIYLKERTVPSASETSLSLEGSADLFEAGETLTGLSSGASAVVDVILSSDGLIEKGEVFADGLYTVGLTIAGSNTDPDHYMWLSVAQTDQHKGLAGQGVVIDPVGLGHVIDIQDAHTHIVGLEITGWPNQSGSNSWEGVHIAADKILLENLLIHDDDYGSYSNPNSDGINLNDMKSGEKLTVRNSIIYNIGRGGIVYQGTEDLTLNAQNVSIYNTALSGSAADGDGGIRSRGSAVIYNLHNVISMNSDSGDDFNNAGSYGSSSNNISSDNSAPGSSAEPGRFAVQQFVSIVPGKEDLHLKATASAVDTGLDLSLAFTGDIDGMVRSGPFDIGADEFEGGLSIARLNVLVSGNGLIINDQLKNDGSAGVGAFEVSYYLSLDTTYDVSDTLVCSRSVSGLAAGALLPTTGTTQSICNIPLVTSGDYFVLAWVDSSDLFTESNEDNNTASSERLLIEAGSPPLLPVITAFSPLTGTVGTLVTISGQNLDIGAPNISVSFFNNVSAPIGSTSPNTLTVTVPPGAMTGPLTVSTLSGSTASALDFSLVSAPTINNITPSSGKIGTVVTIAGQNFDPIPSNNNLSFNGQPAIITTATTTQITGTVPQGATTGLLTLGTALGSASSASPFSVTLSEDFSVLASPATVTIVPGGNTAVQLSFLTAGEAPYSGLIGLTLTSAPAELNAFFAPAIGQTGETSFLNLYTETSLSPGAHPITVTAKGQVDGQNIVRTVTFSLNVLAPGTTTLSGQILSSDTGNPLANILVKNGGNTLTTDAAGNFFFASIANGTQLLLVDGTPAKTTEVSYPIDLPVQVEVEASINNVLPYPVYLHEVNTKNVSSLDTSAGEILISDPDIPGFELTFPQGVQVIGWDGLPNTQMSIRSVPVDRSPLPPLPDNAPAFNIYMFHFFKPGGGTPTQPIPVKFPNDAGLKPGTVVDLYYYDEEPIADASSHEWKKFGTGTVSSDARQIISDPGVGIPKFCCGGATPTYFGQKTDDRDTPDDPPEDGDPVDLTTGTFGLEKTDLVLPGFMSIRLTRSYKARSGLLQSNFSGPFGLGTNHNFNHRLTDFGTSGGALLLLKGNDRRGVFSGNANGTFTNEISPSLRGVVVTVSGSGIRTLRYPNGRKWIFNSTGDLTRIEDRNGNVLTLSRDSQKRLVKIAQDSGRALIFRYDGASRITRITDPLTRTIEYSYNGAGTLASVVDPEGGVTRYGYDTLGRMTRITDARGILFLSNEYDTKDRVIRQTNAEGGIYEFKYFGPEGKAVLAVPGTLFQPQVVGSNCGRFIVQLSPGQNPPSGARCVIWEIEKGPADQLVSQTIVTDPLGNPTSYRFSSAGYTLETIDAAGKSITFERAVGSNELLSTTDALGRKRAFTYDDANNLLTTTDSEGNVTIFTYETNFNRVETITDALGQMTTFTYDAQGNLLTTTDPSGAVTTLTYTAEGQAQTITDALGNLTQLTYDGDGNLIQTTDPLGNTTKRSYDPVSRLLTVTDALGQTTAFAYDKLNRVSKITDPASNITAFDYDENGNLLKVTDANSNSTVYTYDVQDRLETRIDPLLRTESYTYDLNGNLESFLDRKNQSTTFTYDPLDRRIRTNYADGNQTDFIYDTVGRLGGVDEGGQGILFAYDNLDRLVTELSPQGKVDYSYDILGRRNTLSVNGGLSVNYSYDANSRLTQVVQGAQIVGLNYDLAGRRTNLNYSNGTNTSYAYDEASHLTNITHQVGSIPFESVTYDYDAAGNRISLDRTNGASILLPDAVQAAYDAANEQIQFNSATPNLTYDANGNLESQTDSAGTTNYTWDVRNRLSNINGPSTTASFVYDALGRRTSKTISGEQINYQYDGNDIVAEIVGGAVSASYLRSLSIDEPFVRQGISTEYYHVDVLGSTLDLTDSAGAVSTTYEYEAFGKTVVNGASDNPFQYTGRENDGTGLYFYRLRYYNASNYRFLNEDPISFLGGDVNLYSYVFNSPLIWFDPFGLCPFCLAPAVPAIGAAVAEAAVIVGGIITGAIIGDAVVDSVFESRDKGGNKGDTGLEGLSDIQAELDKLKGKRDKASKERKQKLIKEQKFKKKRNKQKQRKSRAPKAPKIPLIFPFEDNGSSECLGSRKCF